MFTQRRYLTELFSGLALYMLLLFGGVWAEHHLHPVGASRLAMLLTPMIGVAAVALAVLRGLWRMDEMQQRIQFEAIGIAFLVTAVVTLGWGFAELGGAPTLPTFAVWPIMGASWLVGCVVVNRRYR